MAGEAITCSCGKRLRLPDGFEGKRLLCPGCKSPIEVGGPPQDSLAPAPDETERSLPYKSIGLVCAGAFAGILAWSAVGFLFGSTRPAEQKQVEIGMPAASGSKSGTESSPAPGARQAIAPERTGESDDHGRSASLQVKLDPAMLDEAEELKESTRLTSLGRFGEAERILAHLRSPLGKAQFALMIGEYDPVLKSMGVTDFDRERAERLVAESLPILESRAEADPFISRTLGSLYLLGIGVEKKPEDGFRYVHAAASKQDEAAMHQLALCYLEGSGVTKNVPESLKILKQLAERRYCPSMVLLGSLYQEGEAVESDLGKALQLFEDAASLEDVGAMVLASRVCGDLASKYFKAGMSDPARTSKARNVKEKEFKYLLLAAIAGSSEAMGDLAIEFRRNTGFLGNSEVEMYWLKRACEAELAAPLMYLGGYYLEGRGVLPDPDRAVDLFRRALEAAKRDKQSELAGSIQELIDINTQDGQREHFLSLLGLPDIEKIVSTFQNDTTPRSGLLDEPPTETRTVDDEREESPAINRSNEPKLQLIDSAWQPTPTGRYVRVQGRIKNISGSPLDDVIANVTFEDANGGLVTTSKAIVTPNPLQPGEVGTFEAMEQVDQDFDHYGLNFMHVGGGSIPAAKPSQAPRSRRRR